MYRHVCTAVSPCSAAGIHDSVSIPSHTDSVTDYHAKFNDYLANSKCMLNSKKMNSFFHLLHNILIIYCFAPFRKGIWPVKRWVLVVCWCLTVWLEFARLVAPVVSTTFHQSSLAPMKSRIDTLVSANRGPPGKVAVKMVRERGRGREREISCLHTSQVSFKVWEVDASDVCFVMVSIREETTYDS